VEEDPSAALAGRDLIVLAVKPQDAPEACRGLARHLKAGQLVLSIMAGVELATIKSLLNGHNSVVRCMPNLPMQVGKGMTVYFCDPLLSVEQQRLAEVVLNCRGISLKVEREELVDAATAISGTGPAYLYYFLEHFLLSAVKLGFSPEEAHTLVRQTLAGAVEMWDITSITPAELRRMVTSQGGTTAAASAVFDTGRLGEVFAEGIMAAYKRAKELGKH